MAEAAEEDGATAAAAVVVECVKELSLEEEKEKNGFKCRFCGLAYTFLNTLKAHERVHDVDMPYVCAKCGDSFRYLAEHQAHMISHEHHKMYKCKCGRGFFRYTDLLYHKHPGEDSDSEDEETGSSKDKKVFKPQHPLRLYGDTRRQPYMCQYCSCSYSDSRALKNHLYSHRGERAFNVQASRYMMARDL